MVQAKEKTGCLNGKNKIDSIYKRLQICTYSIIGSSNCFLNFQSTQALTQDRNLLQEIIHYSNMMITIGKVEVDYKIFGGYNVQGPNQQSHVSFSLLLLHFPFFLVHK